MRAGIGICAAVSVVALSAPAAAGAATVEVYDPCSPEASKYGCSPYVAYRAADGEANVVRRELAGGENTQSAVRDEGAPLTAGPGCTQVSLHEARCPSFHMTVSTGDGDDDVDVRKATVWLGPGNDRLDGEFVNGAEGGPGDDVMIGGAGPISRMGDEGDDRIQVGNGDTSVSGGPGDDTIIGGSGRDRLRGDAGRDTVSGGEGDDQLAADDFLSGGEETPTADRLDGGGGRDLVSYVFREAPVRVDLSGGLPAGSAGENDLLSNIEDATGGKGADVLVGDGGANTLLGGPGGDRLRGEGGDDLLEGGEDFDEFDGGAGDDTIDALGRFRWWARTGDSSRIGNEPDRGKEPVACGPGADEIEQVFADVLDPTCERLALYTGPPTHPVLDARPKLGGANATFALPCPKSLRTGGRCPGQVRLDAGGASSSRRFSLPATGGRVRVPLPGGRRPDRLRIRLAYSKSTLSGALPRTWIADLE